MVCSKREMDCSKISHQFRNMGGLEFKVAPGCGFGVGESESESLVAATRLNVKEGKSTASRVARIMFDSPLGGSCWRLGSRDSGFAEWLKLFAASASRLSVQMKI
jgi:hypothetical protein